MFSHSPLNHVRTGVTFSIQKFAVILAAAFALTSLNGCALLSGNLERAAKGAGKVVTYYCENITVPEIRDEVRAAVNKYAAPHSVAITCVDGGPTLESTAPVAPVDPDAMLLDAVAPKFTAWNWRDFFSKPIIIIERG